ncbi:MAG: S41 family peptidase [Armatimonadota bacterium]
MPGYYRYPTINADKIAFVCEDDLWIVAAGGGVARRLTAGVAMATHPCFSPDGKWIAFAGREEGPIEIYLIPSEGGPSRRLTYLAASSVPVAWSGDGQSIICASNTVQPTPRVMNLWSVSMEGGQPTHLPYGKASSIAIGPKGEVLLGRNTADPARWKRYRGGTAGQLWIDTKGDGEFQRLNHLNTNYASPMWMGDRIAFISDHEGIGNIYSAQPDGSDLQRVTNQSEFYVRQASTDGHRIVFQCGGDLYLQEPGKPEKKVAIRFNGPQTQASTKYPNAADHLHQLSIHPKGHSLAAVTRGKLYSFANWEGAVKGISTIDGQRVRMACWMQEGKRLAYTLDDGEENLVIKDIDGCSEPVVIDTSAWSVITSISASPTEQKLAITDVAGHLVLVDVTEESCTLLDHSVYGRISGVCFSPDGAWIAYDYQTGPSTRVIKLANVATGECSPITRSEFSDFSPSWDPEGKYLAFVSYRDYNPVYDSIFFDLNFTYAGRLYLVTLKSDTPNPFVPQPPKDEVEKEKKDEKKEEEKPADGSAEEPNKDEKPADEKKKPTPLEIELEGIQSRVLAFPVPEARYHGCIAIKGKLLGIEAPPRGALSTDPAKMVVSVFSFENMKHEILIRNVERLFASENNEWMGIIQDHRLRILKSGSKPDDNAPQTACKQSGLIELGRIALSVSPRSEWKQIYREAWRMQRERFWTNNMSGIDWVKVYHRYLPLLERIATRAELSDLMWEMQGELGTSHAYEYGGDYRPSPYQRVGCLGADFTWCEDQQGYRLEHILQGDSWQNALRSPLATPGICLSEGDILMAVNGQPLNIIMTPQNALLNLADTEVELNWKRASDGSSYRVTVTTASNDTAMRYREWVATNRSKVHLATDAQVGYLHIPDMMGRGYSEFHRGYLTELDKPSLIVDLRFNGGGHVSPLLLEKLLRKPIGWDVPRYGQPETYPYQSYRGPIVAITNEEAGSDGDIFSHSFKLLKIGTLIGERTWGGVIGIMGDHPLVDGTTTTQPEYAFHFNDVGWSVENYGTDPDIEVIYRPQDYAAGVDPQLDKAIEVILQQIAENPPAKPELNPKPNLELPRLG